MKRILLIVFVVISLGAGRTFAQEVTITGEVKSQEDNTVLRGATVYLMPARRALASTNNTGHFLVRVPANSTIVFSLQGYKEHTLRVGAQNVDRTILLEPSVAQIDEVVVGYQARKREDLTATVVSISGKEIQDQPTGNFMNLLQGKAPGVNIQMNTGSPGQMPSISMRGAMSMNVVGSGADAFLTPTSPLFVIDGVPIDVNGGYEYGFNTAGPNISPISMIPPEDIESIDFLLDAQATALYGSRGAYGVILVTTRRGNSKIPIVQYSSTAFLSAVPQLRPTLGGADERRIRVDQVIGYDTTYNAAMQRIHMSPLLADSLNAYYNNSTDWQSIFYGNQLSHQQNLDFSGGQQTFNYKVNLGFFDQNGVIANTGLKRYTTQSNMQYRTDDDRFVMRAIITGSLARSSMGSGNALNQSGVANSVNSTSLLPSPSLFSGSIDALSALAVHDDSKTGVLRPQLDLEYEPIKGLRLSSSGSFEYTINTRDRFTPEELNSDNSLVYGYNDRKTVLYNRNMIAYTKAFDKHIFNVFGFTELTMEDFRANLSEFQGTANNQITVGSGFNTALSRGGVLNNLKPFRSMAYAGSFSYNYDSKYIFDVTHRIDGNSGMGIGNPWMHNPSAGIRWTFHRERFVEENLPWLSTGFAKVSVGRNIISHATLSNIYGLYEMSTTTYNNRRTTAINLNTSPNIFIGPELNTMWDITGALGFLDDKFLLTYSYYYRQIDNQLAEKPIANHNAFSNVFTNERAAVAYGHGFNLQYSPRFQNTDWTFNLGANLSLDRNITAALEDGNRQWLQADDSRFNLPVYYSLGLRTGTFVLYNYEGVYQSDEDVPVNPLTGLRYRAGGALADGRYFRAGDPIFTDINGDYILDENDLVYVGSSMPLMTGGLNFFLKYKGYSLRTQFSYTFDRDILNVALADRFRNYADPTGMNPGLIHADMRGAGAYVPLDEFNIWRQYGDIADYPNTSDFTRIALYDPYRYNSTMYMEDGSYFKINQITLGYDIPRTWSQRFGITSSRIALTGNNLYHFSRYSGPDPELVTALGRDNSNGYPNARNYSFVLSIQF